MTLRIRERFPALAARPELAELLDQVEARPEVFACPRPPDEPRPRPRPAAPIVAAEAAFITAGIGDWLAVESHLDPAERSALRTVCYATRQRSAIAALVDASPALAVERHLTLWDDFSETFAFSSSLHLWAATGVATPAGCADWSIAAVFPAIENGRRSFTGSSYLARSARLADVGRLDLPRIFYAIHPSSPNDRRTPRDFDAEDWAAAIAHLDRTRRVGVVLGIGDDPVPDHPRLVDLTNRTTYLESIEVLKRAAGFLGCASSLSVLAAQRLHPSALAIKGDNPHLARWKHAYYAPHRRFDFLGPSLGALLDKEALFARRDCGCGDRSGGA